MIYKGYEIEAHYLPGADFTVKNGVVVRRAPKAADVDFYRVTAPDGIRWNESSVADAKGTILRHIAMAKMD